MLRVCRGYELGSMGCRACSVSTRQEFGRELRRRAEVSAGIAEPTRPDSELRTESSDSSAHMLSPARPPGGGDRHRSEIVPLCVCMGIACG